VTIGTETNNNQNLRHQLTLGRNPYGRKIGGGEKHVWEEFFFVICRLSRHDLSIIISLFLRNELLGFHFWLPLIPRNVTNEII